MTLLAKHYCKNMKIGIKDKFCIYSKYCTVYPCDYFALKVFWTNIYLHIYICIYVYIHVQVYTHAHFFTFQFSVSGSQSNSAVYMHSYYNIYVKSCHYYNLLLFLASSLLSLRAESILEEELCLSVIAKSQTHSRQS